VIKLDSQKDGFSGAYYPARKSTNKAFIVMFGNTDTHLMTKIYFDIAKELNQFPKMLI